MLALVKWFSTSTGMPQQAEHPDLTAGRKGELACRRGNASSSAVTVLGTWPKDAADFTDGVFLTQSAETAGLSDFSLKGQGNEGKRTWCRHRKALLCDKTVRETSGRTSHTHTHTGAQKDTRKHRKISPAALLHLGVTSGMCMRGVGG